MGYRTRSASAVLTSGSLTGLLAAWLPGQRWFAGGADITGVELTSDIQVASGDPELRHLMVRVASGGDSVGYQVPVGLRAALPPELRPALIGQLADGRFAYDALRDPELAGLLLRGITEKRSLDPLRFVPEAGAVIGDNLRGWPLSADQSNSSVVFGDEAILKVLRRPLPGPHPDLEIPAALARLGSRLVAEPLGWIEYANDDGVTVLAILSRYFPGAVTGWDLALASVAAGQAGFTGQARALGAITARMHAELAQGFGAGSLPADALAGLAATLNADLDAAIADVPQLRAYESGLRSCYRALGRLEGGLDVQRIHGDYHLGQVLAVNGGWIVLDFEGEPAVPLGRRRAFAPALRDVAGMLRSFDYASRQPFMEAATQPGNDQAARQLAPNWARACQDAFCDGYARGCGADLLASSDLLNVFLMQKAVYEVAYEARYRPGWLSIPMSAIAETCA